jgi:hypothetical protein
VENGAFSQIERMRSLGKRVILFASIATRITDRKHDDLLRQKNGRGYPTLTVMDAKGEILTRDIDRNIAGVEKAVQSVLDHARLAKRIAAGEKGLDVDMLLVELRLRRLSVTQAWQRFKRCVSRLGDAARTEADSLILALEIEAWRAQLGKDKGAALNKGCYEAFKAGRRPVAGSRADEYLFYRPVLAGAGHAEDLVTFERAFQIQAPRLQEKIDAAKAKGGSSYAQRQLDGLLGVLTRLRAARK